jgi:hypothetical protein
MRFLSDYHHGAGDRQQSEVGIARGRYDHFGRTKLLLLLFCGAGLLSCGRTGLTVPPIRPPVRPPLCSSDRIPEIVFTIQTDPGVAPLREFRGVITAYCTNLTNQQDPSAGGTVFSDSRSIFVHATDFNVSSTITTPPDGGGILGIGTADTRSALADRTQFRVTFRPAGQGNWCIRGQIILNDGRTLSLSEPPVESVTAVETIRDPGLGVTLTPISFAVPSSGSVAMATFPHSSGCANRIGP